MPQCVSDKPTQAQWPEYIEGTKMLKHRHSSEATPRQFQLRYIIANNQAKMPASQFCLRKCKKPTPCRCDHAQYGKGNGPPGKRPKNSNGDAFAALQRLARSDTVCPHFTSGTCIMAKIGKRDCCFQHIGDACKIRCTLPKNPNSVYCANRRLCAYDHENMAPYATFPRRYIASGGN